MDYNVVCMKWGDKYSADYVNKLYNMVARNTTLPFSFYCLTDNARGIDERVKTLPLPEMNLPDNKERGWRKLTCFKEDFPIKGRILFIDLDTVIVDNIDAFFTLEGDFLVIKHWKPSPKQGPGETAVYRYDSGTLTFLYEDFIKRMEEIRATYRHEQAYVTHTLAKLGRLNFWPGEWTPSFKYNCMPPFPLNYIFEPKTPKGAKMIIFHGNPTPDQALSGATKGTLKKFIRHVRTPQWLKDNWR